MKQVLSLIYFSDLELEWIIVVVDLIYETNVSVNNIECDSFLKALSDYTAQLIKYYTSESL